MSTTLECRALLFDMDGTLVDSSPVIERAWIWWARRHGVPFEPILEVQQGRPNREVLRQFAPPGLDIEAESVAFRRFEEDDTEGIVALPGVREALAAATKGLWAIVTSADRSLAEVRLKATGIPIPNVFVTADAIRCGKPDPECYLLAAAELGVGAEECLVFEDARAGVAAARAARMRVVGVTTSLPAKELQADWHVRDFREIRVQRSGKGFSIGIEFE